MNNNININNKIILNNNNNDILFNMIIFLTYKSF